jgi:hypothetical protein
MDCIDAWAGREAVAEKLKASIKGMLPTGLTLCQFLTEFLVGTTKGV